MGSTVGASVGLSDGAGVGDATLTKVTDSGLVEVAAAVLVVAMLRVTVPVEVTDATVVNWAKTLL